MNFKESKAIYLQIADRICDEILLGQYQEEERIPSVREYAAMVERGIGYFVSSGAKELIFSLRRETFLKDELEHVFRQLYTLGVSDDELLTMYRNFMMKQK